MPLRNTIDVTELLHRAQDWFRDSPKEQIPHKTWGLATRNAINQGQISVSHDEFGVIFDDPSIIPALAAITLGASTEQLAAILTHHGVTAKVVAQAVCVTKPENHQRATRQSLSSWNTANQLVQGMCFDSDNGRKFATEIADIPVDSHLEIAYLLAPTEELWPITKIRRYMAGVDDGTIDVVHGKALKTSDFCFSFVQTDLGLMGDQQLLMMMERAGYLLPGASAEYGFKNTLFYKNLCMNISPKKPNNFTALARVVDRIEDQSLVQTMCKLIAESLGNHDFRGSLEGQEVINQLANLNQEKFGSLSQSTVLKLNVLPFDLVANFRKYEPDENSTDSSNPGYEQPFTRHPFYEQRATVLKTIGEELMALDASDFRSEHFKAIHRGTVEWNYTQDLEGIDLKALLTHVLIGWDSYQAKQNDPANGFTPDLLSASAGEHLSGLIKLVASTTKPDYQAFSSFSSAAKALLARNGYDIRQLPGINNKDRGRVLCDELGL